MKNKVYLFLFLCCMVNFVFAHTDKHYSNEANPSFNELTETNKVTNETPLFACDAETLVSYDLDDCLSLPNDNSSRDFSEFTPAFPNSADCARVEASGVFREGSNHSCVAGANGSTAAICVPTHSSSSFRADDDDAVRFEITVNSGSSGRLTGLSFYQLSPRNFLHLSGRSGRNDYARDFGILIERDGREIFRRTDLSLSLIHI